VFHHRYLRARLECIAGDQTRDAHTLVTGGQGRLIERDAEHQIPATVPVYVACPGHAPPRSDSGHNVSGMEQQRIEIEIQYIDGL
jgi:hypothetical protein